MNYYLLNRVGFTAVSVFFGAAAWAVVESKLVPVQVDWAKLKVKTQGAAKLNSSSADWKATEQAAWQDGFRKLEAYYQETVSGVEKQQLREMIRAKTQSSNTTYFADGTVRIDFESALPEVFTTPDSTFVAPAAEIAETPRNSALVFRLSGSQSPRAQYKVLSTDGETLFSVKDVSAEGFKENLMGRWYSGGRAKSSMQQFIGENPSEVSVSSNGSDLIVDKTSWLAAAAGNASLLRQAKIAIVVEAQP